MLIVAERYRKLKCFNCGGVLEEDYLCWFCEHGISLKLLGKRLNVACLLGKGTGVIAPTLLGDCNGDGAVDISDLVIVGAAFGSEPGQPRWNAAADEHRDDIIDVFDLVAVAMHYGETG